MPGRQATLAACSKTPASIRASSASVAMIRAGTSIPSLYVRGSSQTVGETLRSWEGMDMTFSSDDAGYKPGFPRSIDTDGRTITQRLLHASRRLKINLEKA